LSGVARRAKTEALLEARRAKTQKNAA
jgi:hypothetical protein